VYTRLRLPELADAARARAVLTRSRHGA
jgi:hypothetical protein